MTSDRHQRCDEKARRPAIRLPVIGAATPAGSIARSRSAPVRAIVLAVVQVVIIGHIVLWLLSRQFGWFGGGRTLTPVEPSESMEFVKHGAVNAGLIFFALALLATLLLGRWFCGWGCHVVLLQDLCGWMLRRVGIHPKPFRSRLLLYVPLILALYMFIWPAVYRWGVHPVGVHFGWWPDNLVPWRLQSHLVTTDFWRTFAGVAVAIPFLAVCGFATVYFLGNKGFCTYGCPYGGFFAPLDRWAPARIRVTDACEGCGHCTAVCTSNVRVHAEVRDYGMVVDPGCMKCMDCVSVCPKDALYWGWGKPAALAKPRREPKPRRAELSWGEEIGLAVVFFIVFMCVRSAYGLIPMLMAAGIAGCLTWMCWTAWRMLRVENVHLHRIRLRLGGRTTGAGRWFVLATAALLVLSVHSGVVRAAWGAARFNADRVPYDRDRIFRTQDAPPLTPEQVEHADRAVRYYGWASTWTEGGLAIPGPWQTQLDLELARVQVARGDFTSGEQVVRRAIERDGRSDSFCSSLAWILRATERETAALAYYEEVLADNPSFSQMLTDYLALARDTGQFERGLAACERRLSAGYDSAAARWKGLFLRWLNQRGSTVQHYREVLLEHRDEPDIFRDFMQWVPEVGRYDDAVALCNERLERFPNDPDTLRWKALLVMELGDSDAGIELIRRAIEIDPDHVDAFVTLVQVLGRRGRHDEALAAARQSVESNPDSPVLLDLLADVLQFHGRAEEAREHRERAQELHAH